MNAPLDRPASTSRRFGWLVLLCLFAIFAAYVVQATPQLPDRVATHFGPNGAANGWMSRMRYRNFTLGIGIGTPLFIIGTFALVQRLKGWGLNIPNKNYWLAPERQRTTYEFLGRQGLWLAAMLVIFHGAIFHQIVAANRLAHVALPTGQTLATTGIFLAAIGVWLAALIRRFRLPSA